MRPLRRAFGYQEPEKTTIWQLPDSRDPACDDGRAMWFLGTQGPRRTCWESCSLRGIRVGTWKTTSLA